MDHDEVVRLYGPWRPGDPTDVVELFDGYAYRWWIAGGWAIEAFTGVVRPHGDIDPSVPRADGRALLTHLQGEWDVWAADQGTLTPLITVDAVIPATCSNLWLRRSDSDPWEHDVILMDTSAGLWTYKRDARVALPFDEILWEREGVRYLRPEIQLLHKAPGLRPQDQQDFAATVPLLSPEATRWLRSALETAHPGHPWIGRLTPTAPLSSALLGETDRYFDPVWRVEVTLTPLEQRLLAEPVLRRLAHISHAGAASLLSAQTYSRLDHSLGLLALVSHLRPEDGVMRLAALVHDIGHLPLSHTLERALGVSHHALGDARVRSLNPLLSDFGVDAEDIVDAIAGRGPSSLGRNDGTMTLDHFESYVRSAHVHGTTWEAPYETLEAIELLGAGVSCDAETANYLFALMTDEAERQSHPHNVRANAVTGWLVQRAANSVGAKSVGEISEMIDRDLWAWLDSVPEACEPTRDLLLQPERWSVRAVEADPNRPGALLYEIPRFYVDPPLIDGARGAWPPTARSRVARLPRRFAVDAQSPQ